MDANTRKFVLVNNVNTDRSRHADFDIHLTDCSTLSKYPDVEKYEIEAATPEEAASVNNEEIRGSGSFDEDAEWEHRSHTCVRMVFAKSSGRTGATGPRYTVDQLDAGHAARTMGASWPNVAKAAGVKSPSYFSTVLRKTFPEMEAVRVEKVAILKTLAEIESAVAA